MSITFSTKYQNTTRLLRFSAYALTIFTEYTVWAAFGEMSRSTGKKCSGGLPFCYKPIRICKWSIQIYKWKIQYAHRVLTICKWRIQIYKWEIQYAHRVLTICKWSIQIYKWKIQYAHRVLTICKWSIQIYKWEIQYAHRVLTICKWSIQIYKWEIQYAHRVLTICKWSIQIYKWEIQYAHRVLTICKWSIQIYKWEIQYAHTGFLHFLNKKIPWLSMYSMTFYTRMPWLFRCFPGLLWEAPAEIFKKPKMTHEKTFDPTFHGVTCVSLFMCPMSKSHQNPSTLTMWEQHFFFFFFLQIETHPIK